MTVGAGMPDEIEVTACCDAFAQALEDGCLQLGQMETGEMVELLSDASGEASFIINFCPFCGEPRPREAEPIVKPAR
jgi:hypothetical protein